MMLELKKGISTGIDTVAIRAAAKHLDDGAVTVGYQADRHEIIALDISVGNKIFEYLFTITHN